MAQSGVDYDKIASEAIEIGMKPKKDDSSTIQARIVEKLKEQKKAEGFWNEGDSEEPLWNTAREMYWNWCDAQRAKKKAKSGEEEYLDTEPMEA